MKKLSLLVMLASLACLAVHGADMPSQNGTTVHKARVSSTAVPSLLHPAGKTNDSRLAHPGMSQRGLYQVPGFNGMRRATAKAGEAGSEPIYATVIYSEAWPTGGNARFGVYELPTTGQAPERLNEVYLDYHMYANGGAVYANGEYILTNYVVYDGATIIPVTYIYDASTWQLKGQVDGDITSMATDMAYDEMTEKIYGCFFSQFGSEMNFAVLDPTRGTSTRITTLTTAWNACAIDPQGVLYAIDLNGVLSTVDKTTGAMTTIGDTGLKPRLMSSATFNPLTGTLYYVCCSVVGQSYLYEIDTTTAEPTLLYALPGGEGVAGLFIPRAASGLESPASVANLELQLDGASLSGQLEFDMPTTTYNGEPLSGQLSYNVILDGTLYTTGEKAAGEHVSVALTVTAAGSYNIAVEAFSDKGKGPKSHLVRFIGEDRPAVVQNVNVAAGTAEGSYTVSWDPVIKGENGGYIDPAAVTYTVTRYTKGATDVVKTDIKDSSFTDTFIPADGASPLTYGVTARIDGVVTAESLSNTIVVGAYSTPYSESFGTVTTDRAAYEDYTVIDVDSDNKTWGWYNTKSFGNCWNCAYSTANPKNDWLITPPIYLEAGNQYDFSFLAGTYSADDFESFEAAFGTTPTVAGMSTIIVPETEFSTPVTTGRRYTGSVIIEQSGVYYFGIHATSRANAWNLYIDDIEVSAPRSTETPAAVDNLSVTRHWDGSIKADLVFTTPTKTASGKQLSSIEKIEVLRDGELVHTIQPVLSTGMSISWTDDDRTMERGDHIYTVVAYNEHGRGNEAQAEAFIGVNRSEEVPNPRAELTDVMGQVRVTWDAPSVDIKGEPLNLDIVTYTILSTDDENNIISIASDLTGLEYIDQAVREGQEQKFKSYAVVAVTDAGMSSAATTDIVVPGPAYQMPYVESFPNHTPTYILGTVSDSETGSQWGFYKDDSMAQFASQDGDNGYVAYLAKGVGARSALTSGKIHINNGPHPVLTFYYIVTSADDANTYEVEVTCEGRKEIAATFSPLGNTNTYTWQRAEVPLDKYAGKDIQLALWVTCVEGPTGSAMGSAIFDNFRVVNKFDHNLTAREFNNSSIFDINVDSQIKVIVENLGTQRAEGYRVDLFIDGDPAGSATGRALAPMATAQVSFTHRFTILDPEQVEITAMVVYDADEYPDDDLTPVMNATILLPDYPAPAGVKARYSAEGGVDLSWTASEATHTRPVATSETFESYDSWARDSFGGWISLDRDGHKSAQFEEIEFPFGSDPVGFFVLDKSKIHESYRSAFHTRSGDKMISNLPAKGDTGSTVDDWLISPELTGQAQSVSFYARSYHDSYRETFQILLSDTNNDWQSFKTVAQYSFISSDWTRYDFDVPAGTRFFAIRCTSTNEYLLLLDDFTFIAKDGPVDLSRLTGYNIYRDGILLNPQPVAETSFYDPDGTASNYVITGVYDKGESRPSAVANPELSGIDSAAASALSVRVEGSDIVVGGAAGRRVRIIAADGRELAASHDGADSLRATVAPGVYIVAIGDCRTTKVVVR